MFCHLSHGSQHSLVFVLQNSKTLMQERVVCVVLSNRSVDLRECFPASVHLALTAQRYPTDAPQIS